MAWSDAERLVEDFSRDHGEPPPQCRRVLLSFARWIDAQPKNRPADKNPDRDDPASS
jgi:hypothetical protein